MTLARRRFFPKPRRSSAVLRPGDKSGFNLSPVTIPVARHAADGLFEVSLPAQTPAHMSTLEAILARMTARPTEKDVAEAERLQKVMAGAD